MATSGRFDSVLAVATAIVWAQAAGAERPPAAAGPPVVASQCDAPPGFAPPFTRVYQLRDGRTLVFVAVHHGRDPGDASHRLIAEAIDRFAPGLVYIEGIDTGSPAAIAFQRTAAERQSHSGAIGESLYAVKLAGDRGIAFASWDYRPDEAMRYDVAQGFALADIVGAHLLRAGADPAEPKEETARRRDLGYAARVGAIDGFDYGAWYRRHYDVPFAAANATPCGTGIAADVLKAESDARSARLAERVMHPVGHARVVMVEAGANHWVALQAWLRRLSTSVE